MKVKSESKADLARFLMKPTIAAADIVTRFLFIFMLIAIKIVTEAQSIEFQTKLTYIHECQAHAPCRLA